MPDTDTQTKFLRLLREGLPKDVELVVDRSFANEGYARIQYETSLESIVTVKFSFQPQGITTLTIIGPAGWNDSERVALAERMGSAARVDYDGFVHVYARHPGELEAPLHQIKLIVDAVYNTPEFVEPISDAG